MEVRNRRIGNVSLEVAEAGAGGRPLLAVHGFTGAKEDLTEAADELASAGWWVVAPDLRGHGGSENLPGEDSYSPEAMVSDLLGLAASLGWERFAVLGHSMGGALAQLLAIDHPERVSALVLIGTFCGPVRDLEPALVQLGASIVRQGGLAALAPALAARREASPEAAEARARLERERPGFAEAAERRLQACSADMWLAMAPRFLSWPDTSMALATTGVPTLVITGSDDTTMRADCERLASVVPGARLVVVEGAAHSPQLERPALVWSQVTGFLQATVPEATNR